ncbi:hypothetical protein [Niveispirillum sp. SYP-B3756]|nr:hypothetical protein [Niveispirillum sp. SYP-B3756]
MAPAIAAAHGSGGNGGVLAFKTLDPEDAEPTIAAALPCPFLIR